MEEFIIQALSEAPTILGMVIVTSIALVQFSRVAQKLADTADSVCRERIEEESHDSNA